MRKATIILTSLFKTLTKVFISKLFIIYAVSMHCLCNISSIAYITGLETYALRALCRNCYVNVPKKGSRNSILKVKYFLPWHPSNYTIAISRLKVGRHFHGSLVLTLFPSPSIGDKPAPLICMSLQLCLDYNLRTAKVEMRGNVDINILHQSL